MRHLILCAVLVITAMVASAQSLSWTSKNAHEFSSMLNLLPPVDREGITSHLHLKGDDLAAEKIPTRAGSIYFVRRLGADFCGAVGNCSFWVLDSRYRVILKSRAQVVSLLPSIHGDRQDVLTSLHDSAYQSDRTQWRFHGGRYQEFACANVNYGDPNGNLYKRPHIVIIRCK